MTRKQLELNKKKLDASLLVATTLSTLGINSGELTYSQARQRYGDWLRDKVERGDIAPCRIGKGQNPTRWFAITDILALKSLEVDNALYIINK